MNTQSPGPIRRDIVVTSPTTPLNGRVTIPSKARGAVLIARGPADGRRAPLLRFVANLLNEAGFATLLLDLVSERERPMISPPHDVAVLGARLVRATHWLHHQPGLRHLGVGLWAMEDTAGAALIAGAYLGDDIRAIVNHQPRFDLGSMVLRRVKAPTLFVAIDRDEDFAESLRAEMLRMGGRTELFTTETAFAALHDVSAPEVVGRVAARFFTQWVCRENPVVG